MTPDQRRFTCPNSIHVAQDWNCPDTAQVTPTMTDFSRHGLDEDAFGDKSGLTALKTFDAFRMPFCYFSDNLKLTTGL